MNINHVTEFSVLVPSELSDQSKTVMTRFKAHLEMQFPGYTFSLATFVRALDSRDVIEIEDWMVIPCMGTVGDGTPFRMLPMPDPELVRQIMQCCKDYCFDGKAGLAA